MLQATQLLKLLTMCGNTPLRLQGVGRGHLWGCHSVSHTPTLVAQGSGGLSGRSLDLAELEFCLSRPPPPRSPQIEVSGVWLPCSLRARRQASRPGHHSPPPRGGPPSLGLGPSRSCLWPAGRWAVVCGPPGHSGPGEAGRTGSLAQVLSVLSRQHHTGSPAPSAFPASLGG